MNKTKILYLAFISAVTISIATLSILNDIPKEKPVMSVKEALVETTTEEIILTSFDETTELMTMEETTEITSLTTKNEKSTLKNTTVSSATTTEITVSTTIPIIILNTATAEELMLIPEIDEELSQKIIDLRNTIQYFSSPYELLYIDTMNENRLSKIINYIYVDNVN